MAREDSNHGSYNSTGWYMRRREAICTNIQ